MIAFEKLNRILMQYEALCAELNTPHVTQDRFIALSKEYAELESLVEEIRIWQKLQQNKEQAQDLLSDPEMASVAKEEIISLTRILEEKEQTIKLMMLPKDEDDQKNVILEVRAGTGGDEAALFAASLLRMYERYAHHRKWAFDIIGLSPSEMGGIKEASALIKGQAVFARLKHESGVHRVQRVPVTESSGRIHTSAATVAILPEATEIETDIRESDLRIDVYRASGAGGQHVNKTESAVRIIHIPTGLMVTQQSERSQRQNRLLAMKFLATKLHDMEKKKADHARASDRKEQVGSGDRSGRIRTYNFPQGRVTDHRIHLTVHALEDILEGGSLDLIIEPLMLDEQAQKLAQLL